MMFFSLTLVQKSKIFSLFGSQTKGHVLAPKLVKPAESMKKLKFPKRNSINLSEYKKQKRQKVKRISF